MTMPLGSLRPLSLIAALTFLPATPAWAAGDKPADAGTLLAVLLAVVLGFVAAAAMGAVALLLRILLPGATRAADASIGRLGAKALALGGVLPLLGAGLMAQGVGRAGNEWLGGAFVLLVLLPLFLAFLLGLMAVVPYVGARALRPDPERAPLVEAGTGGVLVGLAMATWVLPPLGLLLTLLLAGWCVATGLGTVLHRTAPTQDAAAPASTQE